MAAGELGGLPLALEQAAAYVQATAESLAGYLALFRPRRADLLSRGEPTRYSQTVAATWRLAFEDVQQTTPRAAGLLRLLAFCAPEAIPLRLLLQPRPGLAGQFGEEVATVLEPLLEDPLAAGDAIAALRRYSLITQATGGSVSVHRLVQAVTAAQMPAELASQWRLAAAVLIEDAIPANAEPPATWPVCAALLPHVQAALADDSDGVARIANYLGRSGSYAAARDLQRRMVEARERVLGPEHPRTLGTRGNLARWTGAAGDAAGPGTSTLRCCRSAGGSRAPSTPARSPPASTWPTGPGWRRTRDGETKPESWTGNGSAVRASTQPRSRDGALS